MSRLRRTAMLVASTAILATGWCTSASSATGDLDLVSWPGEPTLSGREVRSATEPSISDDGRYVTYTLTYTLDDPNGCCEDARAVVVRDLVTGEVDVVSRADGDGGEFGDGDSQNAKISGNGRYVVFESNSSNLLGHETNAYGIYRRDLQTGTTILVRSSVFWGLRNADISDDGRYVSFEENNYDGDVSAYVKDLQTGDVTAVSRTDGAGASESTYYAGISSISGDGSKVSFFSFNDFDGRGTGGTYVRDLAAKTTEMASLHDGAAGDPFIDVAARPSSLSTDGHLVAFGGFPVGQTVENPYPDSQVYVRNLNTDSTTLISRPSGAASEAYVRGGNHPSISGDGHYVAFEVDQREFRDVPVGSLRRAIMVRDTLLNTTTEVSLNTEPEALDPDGTSETPAITADGSYVAFSSNSSTLSEDDLDGMGVFRKDLLGGSAGSITGPTAPGPAREVDGPTDGGSAPTPNPGPGSDNPSPPPSTLLATTLGLAGAKSHRLTRVFSVKAICRPVPCTASSVRPSLLVAGIRSGSIHPLGSKVLSPGYTKFTFRLSLKQYKQATRALKKRKRVSAELLFSASATGRTAARLPLSIRLTK